MKLWTIALCLLVVCGSATAKRVVWQPAVGHTQIPLWPGTPPDAQPTPGPEYMVAGHKLIGGKRIVGVYNVSRLPITGWPRHG